MRNIVFCSCHEMAKEELKNNLAEQSKILLKADWVILRQKERY